MNLPKAAMKVPKSLAEEDARPVEGILVGAGLGAVFWAVVAVVAAMT